MILQQTPETYCCSGCGLKRSLDVVFGFEGRNAIFGILCWINMNSVVKNLYEGKTFPGQFGSFGNVLKAVAEYLRI